MDAELVKSINEDIFREYDIRGISGEDLNPDIVFLIGKAIGTYVKRFGDSDKIVIARDARLTSDEYKDACIKGILSSGISVIDIGRVPTPVSYFANYFFKISAGVMITASHNPSEYNGIYNFIE